MITTSVILGRFMPPHEGHLALIRTASYLDRLTNILSALKRLIVAHPRTAKLLPSFRWHARDNIRPPFRRQTGGRLLHTS